MPAKKNATREIASRIRAWLSSNPHIHVLTVPMLHRELGGAERHEWEQALARLNKTGDVSQQIKPLFPHGDGDERAGLYNVNRKPQRK